MIRYSYNPLHTARPVQTSGYALPVGAGIAIPAGKVKSGAGKFLVVAKDVAILLAGVHAAKEMFFSGGCPCKGADGGQGGRRRTSGRAGKR